MFRNHDFLFCIAPGFKRIFTWFTFYVIFNYDRRLHDYGVTRLHYKNGISYMSRITETVSRKSTSLYKLNSILYLSFPQKETLILLSILLPSIWAGYIICWYWITCTILLPVPQMLISIYSISSSGSEILIRKLDVNCKIL